jgi:hypothetical protein
MTINSRKQWFGLVAGCLFALAWPSVSVLPAAAGKDEPSTAADTTMTLQGGEGGTTFKSLRIEGEDLIRIEFDRPGLDLALDARTAPGLDFEIVRAALARNDHDFVMPFMARSAVTRGPLYARPWFDTFVSGSVVCFRPEFEGVERWRLDVADSRGHTVMSFEGKGKPPKELSWDGRTLDGTLAPPGLTYSYVLEAYDRAGNKRNFVGEGFELPPYVVQGPPRFALLFAGKALRASVPSAGDDGLTPPILLEAATRINQSVAADDLVRVEVTARSFDEAKQTADLIVAELTALVLGDPLRFQPITSVEPDAPEAGTVRIEVGVE